MLINKKEKIYQVEFMGYTNAIKDTVSDWSGDDFNVPKLGEETYLDVGLEPFLVRESQLEFFKKFGRGYRSIKFVGYLCDPVENCKQEVNENESKSEIIYDTREVPSATGFPSSVSTDVIIPTVFNSSHSSPETDLGEYFQVNYSKDTTTTTTFSNNEQ